MSNATGTREHGAALNAVRLWLWLIVALILVMIAVGGATRLTGSGLSITEWRPVTGLIPPLTHAQWEEALALYRQIPQYQLVNKGMSLDAFKVIYWWEWGHRFLGRLIGLAFFVPLAWFWWRGMIGRALGARLVVIFVLGAAQGVLGWYMVMSGLADRIDVSQYRLAAHLGLAFLIMAAVLWTILDLSPRRAVLAGATAGRRTAALLCVLIFVQILLGGLVAGLNAGMAFNTWPLMDGTIVPPSLFAMQPWYVNFFESVKTVQFDHRMLAYAIWLIAAGHWCRLHCAASPHAGAALVLFILVSVQAALGIAALLAMVPLWLGLVHQLGAAVLLAAALYHLHGYSTRDPATDIGSPGWIAGGNG